MAKITLQNLRHSYSLDPKGDDAESIRTIIPTLK